MNYLFVLFCWENIHNNTNYSITYLNKIWRSNHFRVKYENPHRFKQTRPYKTQSTLIVYANCFMNQPLSLGPPNHYMESSHNCSCNRSCSYNRCPSHTNTPHPKQPPPLVCPSPQPSPAAHLSHHRPPNHPRSHLNHLQSPLPLPPILEYPSWGCLVSKA